MPSAFEAIPQLFLILLSFPLFAVAFLKIVGMMLEHSIDVVPGVIALGIAFALFGAMCISTNPVVPWAILLVVATMLAFYPFAARQWSDLDHRRIHRGQVEKFYAAWAERPDNAPAALSLSAALYDFGYRAAGIHLAESVLERYSRELDPVTLRAPRDFFRQEEQLLKQWKRVAEPRQFEPVRCPNCLSFNPAHELQCSQCGRPHILERIRSGDGGAAMAGKLVLTWALIAGLIVATVAAATTLHDVPRFVTILGGFGGVAWALAWLFRRPKFEKTGYRPLVED